MTTLAGVRSAYEHCEQITRSQARNFSYGIRLLPEPKRFALSAVYAFARRVDDIGDGELPAERKLSLLAQARDDVHRASFDSPDPVLVALAHASTHMSIPLAAFDELVEGCEADVRGTAYRSFDELAHYCHCVAGSIGRLSLGVFGTPDPRLAEPLADALGIALQLTNILRDLLEDRRKGRVYLPDEDLARFGVTLTLGPDGGFADVAADLAALVRFEAQRAESWYSTGLRLLPLIDRRSRACCAAMAGIYHRLLHRIAAAPEVAVRGRMSLSGWQKTAVAVRSLAGMPP